MAKYKILIIIASAAVAILILALAVVFINRIPPKKEILGEWYTWHGSGMDWTRDVLTFYEDATYETSSFAGMKEKYTRDKDTIYLEGVALYRSLVLGNQDGQLILMADNGWLYYRTEEAAQADLDRRRAEEPAQQEEPNQQSSQEPGSQQEERVKDEKVAEDILGNWTNKANVDLSFYDDGRYMIIDAAGKIKIGSYRMTGSRTMIIVDPDTQSEAEIEIVLTVVPYEDGSDQFRLSSKYFEWAGDFYRYQYYDID